jgi:MOB kinase activator 1
MNRQSDACLTLMRKMRKEKEEKEAKGRGVQTSATPPPKERSKVNVKPVASKKFVSPMFKRMKEHGRKVAQDQARMAFEEQETKTKAAEEQMRKKQTEDPAMTRHAEENKGAEQQIPVAKGPLAMKTAKLPGRQRAFNRANKQTDACLALMRKMQQDKEEGKPKQEQAEKLEIGKLEERASTTGAGDTTAAAAAEAEDSVYIDICFTFTEHGAFGMSFNAQGVITHVETGGQAASLGIEKGDVIVEVADEKIHKATLRSRLKALQRPGDVTVRRYFTLEPLEAVANIPEADAKEQHTKERRAESKKPKRSMNSKPSLGGQHDDEQLVLLREKVRTKKITEKEYKVMVRQHAKALSLDVDLMCWDLHSKWAPEEDEEQTAVVAKAETRPKSAVDGSSRVNRDSGKRRPKSAVAPRSRSKREQRAGKKRASSPQRSSDASFEANDEDEAQTKAMAAIVTAVTQQEEEDADEGAHDVSFMVEPLDASYDGMVLYGTEVGPLVGQGSSESTVCDESRPSSESRRVSFMDILHVSFMVEPSFMIEADNGGDHDGVQAVDMEEDTKAEAAVAEAQRRHEARASAAARAALVATQASATAASLSASSVAVASAVAAAEVQESEEEKKEKENKAALELETRAAPAPAPAPPAPPAPAPAPAPASASILASALASASILASASALASAPAPASASAPEPSRPHRHRRREFTKQCGDKSDSRGGSTNSKSSNSTIASSSSSGGCSASTIGTSSIASIGSISNASTTSTSTSDDAKISEFEVRRRKREQDKAQKAKEAEARRQARRAKKNGTQAAATPSSSATSGASPSASHATTTTASTSSTVSTASDQTEWQLKKQRREEAAAKKAVDAKARREARAAKKNMADSEAKDVMKMRELEAAAAETRGYISGEDPDASDDEGLDDEQTLETNTNSEARARCTTLGESEFDLLLPQDLELNEWIAMNTMDLHNELSLLTGLVADSWDLLGEQKPGEGFPKGFEYRWTDGETIKTPIRCSTSEYVDFVMQWVEGELEDPSVFPHGSEDYRADFRVFTDRILTRLFRVYVLLYTCQFKTLDGLQAVQHLNTCFKHFCFFCFEFDAIAPNEYKALRGPVAQMRKLYASGKKTHQRKATFWAGSNKPPPRSDDGGLGVAWWS